MQYNRLGTGAVEVWGKIKDSVELHSTDNLRFRVHLPADQHNPDDDSFAGQPQNALTITEITIGSAWGGSSPITGITPDPDSLRFQFTLAPITVDGLLIGPGDTLFFYDQGVPDGLTRRYFSQVIVEGDGPPDSDLPSDLNSESSWEAWHNGSYEGLASGDPYIKPALA